MRARPSRLVARLALLPVVAAGVLQLVSGPAGAAVPVPATPTGLPAGIEALQPYLGQTLCDPVAKPGVVAFRSLVLATYPGTHDDGIVRACGDGGQSEHKEGRAWDWGVSVTDAAQKADADTLLAWLLRTDAQGHPYAMARRLGIMYMIWNHRIWKSYQADKGWQDYTGSVPHTDHVHFSFGWSGAKKATSYWTGAVAAYDPGPAAPVVPVRTPANVAVLSAYGSTVLKQGTTGTAVATVQRTLRLVVDSAFGPSTVAAVQRFQQQQGLPVTGTFGATEWRTLYPLPVTPFGALDAPRAAPGATVLTGWAVDADAPATALTVRLSVDGTEVTTTTASRPRPDAATSYPGFGTAHGFAVARTLTQGTHTVCATAVNASGTPGTDGALTCRTVTVDHRPSGDTDQPTSVLGKAHVTGWAVDPDTAAPIKVSLSLDGGAPVTVTAGLSRSDLAASWPGWGTGHGFAADLPAPAEGVHQVCLTAVNAGMGADRALGCRSVVVRHSADGALTTATVRPGGVLVAGWALDPDTTAAVPVTVTVDGTAPTTVTAGLAATGLPAAYAANGTAHGFATVLDLAQGKHTVCAFVADATGTPGAGADAGCSTVTALHAAQGALEAVRPVAGGGLVVAGWALDPDVARSTTVQLRVDGGSPRTYTAGLARPDVSAAWPRYGSAHGLQVTLSLPSGYHQVCATAVNAAGTEGGDTPLGCRTVLLGSPTAALDPVRVVDGNALVTGWVLDPDVASAAGWSLRVDGSLVLQGSAGYARRGFGAAHPSYGDGHGFRVRVPLTSGRHTLCLTALNVAGTRGGDRRLSCTTVTMP